MIGFALAMTKAVELRRQAVFADDAYAEVRRSIEKQELKRALTVAEARPACSTRIAAALLRQADRSTDLLKDRANQAGGLIAREMEAGLSGLALVASLGPLFGLFGTVVGITIVFNHLAAGDGGGGPQQLAGGIGTALYTTIAGLIVGVFALVSHRYYSSRLDRYLAELEGLSLDIVERLSERA